jgi:predicted nucleic acid-binding protein
MKALRSSALYSSEGPGGRTVCVDASLVVALLLPERFSPMALALWEQWIAAEVNITAPSLLINEATSALYRKAVQGLIAWEDEQMVLNQLLKLDIERSEPAHLPVRASELAKEFQRPNTYDAFYLAFAENRRCPFWTGDERLFNAVNGRFGLIHWLGEISVI